MLGSAQLVVVGEANTCWVLTFSGHCGVIERIRGAISVSTGEEREELGPEM